MPEINFDILADNGGGWHHYTNPWRQRDAAATPKGSARTGFLSGVAVAGSWRVRPILSWVLCAALLVALSGATASEARGRDHRPTHRIHLDLSGRSRTGVASFYGRHGAAKPTASGAAMDPKQMTAASRTLPLGTTARVVNRDTGKSAVVTITDRGPFARRRILDVSPRAAETLGMTSSGAASVKVTPLHLPR